MVHDSDCEARKSQFPRETCGCAERAYSRDPFVDADGRPVRWGRGYGTAAPVQ